MRLVVSPHTDDAVLGAGAYLAASAEPVLTVFDGWPRAGTSTDYDRSCGFDDSRLAMSQREAENERALELLGCASLGLGMLDRQYNGWRPPKGTLSRRIEDAMRSVGAEGIVAPLGIQHPDHIYVADACLMLATTGVAVWLYEELPYRVVWPEHAADRHATLRAAGWELLPDFLGEGPKAIKEAAVGCYKSQALDVHCCLVPERYWVPRR